MAVLTFPSCNRVLFDLFMHVRLHFFSIMISKRACRTATAAFNAAVAVL